MAATYISHDCREHSCYYGCHLSGVVISIFIANPWAWVQIFAQVNSDQPTQLFFFLNQTDGCLATWENLGKVDCCSLLFLFCLYHFILCTTEHDKIVITIVFFYVKFSGNVARLCVTTVAARDPVFQLWALSLMSECVINAIQPSQTRSKCSIVYYVNLLLLCLTSDSLKDKAASEAKSASWANFSIG